MRIQHSSSELILTKPLRLESISMCKLGLQIAMSQNSNPYSHQLYGKALLEQNVVNKRSKKVYLMG